MGKPGTLSVEDFESLKALVAQYGAGTLAKKVAKTCGKKAATLGHEYGASLVAKAYKDTSSKILSAFGGNGTATAISGTAFTTISNLVGKYGAELVIIKLAKLAKKGNDTATAGSLGKLFPKVAA
jgi:hypothetical protein